MKIKVTYMSGAGNLFSVIDNRALKFVPNLLQNLAPILCINIKSKTEGLLIINESNDGLAVNVDFFNPDGSSNAMCGNGARCALYFAKTIDMIKHDNIEPVSFKMVGEKYVGYFENDLVKIDFPPPLSYELNKIISYDCVDIKVDFFDVGSKHAVVNFMELQKINDLKNIGFFELNIDLFAPPIRYHDAFKPDGVNVNLYKIDSGKIILRTYERGVEAETGACGTGAIATALSAVYHNEIKLPLTIVPPSGSELEVNIIGDVENNIINKVTLKGKAEIIGESLIDIPDDLIFTK